VKIVVSKLQARPGVPSFLGMILRFGFPYQYLERSAFPKEGYPGGKSARGASALSPNKIFGLKEMEIV